MQEEIVQKKTSLMCHVIVCFLYTSNVNMAHVVNVVNKKQKHLREERRTETFLPRGHGHDSVT